jgi:hypothetical protein
MRRNHNDRAMVGEISQLDTTYDFIIGYRDTQSRHDELTLRHLWAGEYLCREYQRYLKPNITPWSR